MSAEYFCVMLTINGNMNTRLIFFLIFGIIGHKIVEILTAELSSPKMYKVGMFFSLDGL